MMVKGRKATLIVLAALALLLACGRRPLEREDPAPPSRHGPGNAKANSELSYALEWSSHNVAPTMKRGSSVPVQVIAKNKGDRSWSDPREADPKGDGSYAIRLGYRWLGPDGTPVTQYEARGDLSSAVPSGGTALFSMNVVAPSETGRYTLQFDLVEELIAWFEDKRAPRLLVPVTIE